jgi:hypothetical protein
VDWSTFALALGTIVTGVAGCMVVIHEFRRRDRRALNDEAGAMSDDLATLRLDLVDCRRYAFELAEHLADHGLSAPEPPERRR